jgi:hypothetical protein
MQKNTSLFGLCTVEVCYSSTTPVPPTAPQLVSNPLWIIVVPAFSPSAIAVM